ncbi:Uncharacterised protein [Chlamydia trachomatis]|nr:Uncharacterised protein [Chlamydia trachomatis]
MKCWDMKPIIGLYDAYDLLETVLVFISRKYRINHYSQIKIIPNMDIFVSL